MFSSRFMPCVDCGASVDRTSDVTHTCDVERLLDYRMFGLREEVASLEDGVVRFLESAHGQFERWLAERQVRRPG